MQLVRLAAIGVALLVIAGGYVQEIRRLAVIKRLGGREALAYYERTRTRTERLLTFVTAGLVLLAVAGAVWAFVLGSRGW